MAEDKYKVIFDEGDGTIGQTEAVPYEQTDDVRTALEVQGQSVIGVQRDTN